MKKPNLPYVERKNIKGRTYYYFRRGKKRIRLPDNTDSEEFFTEYWAIRSGKTTRSVKTTWNALIIEYYKSPEFKEKAQGTRENYRRHCEAIREKNGNKDVTKFRRKDAIAVRAALADNWSKANERLSVLSILCRKAVDLEWIERNPVFDIQKLKGGEYAAWPDEKLDAFERYCDDHGLTNARTIFELCVGTGQRFGDCLKMTWDDFDGEFMNVCQEKTGTKIRVYCPERLQTYLAGLPKAGRHILPRDLTRPIGKRTAQTAVETVRVGLGLMHGKDRLVPHGWRYTAARLLAEAGCSDTEIQSVTGHKSLEMVRKYRKQANQKAASKRAQQRRVR